MAPTKVDKPFKGLTNRGRSTILDGGSVVTYRFTSGKRILLSNGVKIEVILGSKWVQFVVQCVWMISTTINSQIRIHSSVTDFRRTFLYRDRDGRRLLGTSFLNRECRQIYFCLFRISGSFYDRIVNWDWRLFFISIGILLRM